MKALILAAGYATRLYPLTKDRPKPLLPLADRPMIEYIMDKLLEVKEVDHLYVVTNHKFAGHFQDWQRKLSLSVTIVDDGTVSDEDKRGAIGDIHFVMEREGIADDLLIVAGDNLFDFKITGLVEFFKKKGRHSSIVLYDVGDRELVKRYSTVTLDKEDRVIDFQEKPREPQTTLIAICLYLFPPATLKKKIAEYLNSGLNPDAPGYFISWLCKEEPVYGYKVSGRWYDIGGFDSYNKADSEYRCRKENET